MTKNRINFKLIRFLFLRAKKNQEPRARNQENQILTFHFSTNTPPYTFSSTDLIALIHSHYQKPVKHIP